METTNLIQHELAQCSPELRNYVTEIESVAAIHKTIFDKTVLPPVRTAVVISRAFTALLSRDDVSGGSTPYAINLTDDATLLHERLLDMCEAMR